MTTDLERLKALALAATPGDWLSYDCLVFIYEAAHSNMGLVQSVTHAPIFLAKDMLHDDAKFVAAANPAVVLALLDELATARQHQDDLRSQLARASQQVAGLKHERNVLIIERNNAQVRAIKAENPNPLPAVDLAAVRPESGDPDDPLDDVLPLAPRVLPPNLPASLDLPDSEGGEHD